MSINLSMPEPTLLHPKILVIGVGGAGGNAVNNMIASQLQGVEFVVANTDAQALAQSSADRKIQLGASITQGLGAGSRPDVGRAAAEESIEQLIEHLNGAHMVFVTAGMGGGTGTGAAPVIAELARERDILTVGVVTKPFQFEGGRRMNTAEQGILELQQFVDTLIVIPNQNLFRIANEKTTFSDAFSMADEVLHSGVRGVTDLMVMPGLINLDFADVRTVMAEMGKAVMGTGEAEGDNRATEAAQAAISNPLLDDLSITGAQGVLINITGGMDMALFEVDEAADFIRKEVDPNANIIVGSTLDDTLTGRMRVSVVATGLGLDESSSARPISRVTTLHTPIRSAPSSVPAPAAVQENNVSEPLQAVAKVELGAAETVGAISAVKPEVKAREAEDEPFDLESALSAAGEGEEISIVEPAAVSAVPSSVASKDREVPNFGPRPSGEPSAAEAHIVREVRKPAESRSPTYRGQPSGDGKTASRPSLFARMTGAARKAKEVASESKISPKIPAKIPPKIPPKIPMSVKEPARVEPAFEDIREITATTLGSPVQTVASPAPTGIAEVKAVERPVSKPSDDDQLEIPAFLRRQAN